MRIAKRLEGLLAAVAVAACATHVRPASSGPSPADRIASIDALIRSGCYDCLVDALLRAQQLVDSVRPRPGTTAGPTPGWAPRQDAAGGAAERVREAAGLLAIRERDLGLVDQHYLETARAADGADRLLFDVIAALPRRTAGSQRAADEDQLRTMMLVARNRETWRDGLAARVGTTALGTVAAIDFECRYGGDRSAPPLDSLIDKSGPWKTTPLLTFTRAICGSFDAAPLQGLLAADPRFHEIDYFLAIGATMAGDLDGADRLFQAAFAWRQDWPAATFGVANLAMTAEDFDRAAEFYRRTLALAPGAPDAAIGRVRALSFAGRYADAIAAADTMLAGHWYIGDAYYWRAWNETQLNQDAPAWADVGEAAKLIVDADVPKLTGILAIRRQDLPRARSEFELARTRNPNDCETLTLLGGTALELQKWHAATPALTDAVTCLDKRDDDLRAEIERLRTKPGRERILARRQQELASNARLRARSWFNLAVASFNLGDKANARAYAERVAADARFGERARQMIERLRR